MTTGEGPPSDQPQTGEVSSRAEAILKAIEQEALARRRQMESGRAAGAPPALAPPPAGTFSPPLGRESGVGGPATAERLLELVRQVVVQTEAAKLRLDELNSALDRVSARFAAAPGGPATGAVPVPRPPTPPPAPAAEAGPAADSARLVAIEMAVAGFTRGDVAQRLRGEYGISEPDTILDDVYGAGTGDESRMPWGRS